jgi:hypothetical protein
MASRVHRPISVIAFNANGIGRQRYELSKQLQDLHVDVALFSGTHLKPHKRLHIPNYNFYLIDLHPGREGSGDVAVRQGVPHNHADLPPLMSIQPTGVCIPNGDSDILLAAVYISAGRGWIDENITELLNFRNKCILAGDLNAKRLVRNSRASTLQERNP